jgi:hypothetical protein
VIPPRKLGCVGGNRTHCFPAYETGEPPLLHPRYKHCKTNSGAWREIRTPIGPEGLPLYRRTQPTVSAFHAWRIATESNSHPSREPPGSGRFASPLAVRSKIGGCRASRTPTSFRYASLRTRWACHMPNASMAESRPVEGQSSRITSVSNGVPDPAGFTFQKMADTVRFELTVPVTVTPR